MLYTYKWSKNNVHEASASGFSFYGDTNGYLGVSTANFPAGSVARLEIEGEPIIKKSSYTIALSNGVTNEIYPIIEFDYE